MKTDTNFFITNSVIFNSSNNNKKTKNNINKITNYKTKQKEEKEIINENFLNYLINEQTNYANFGKVIDFYEEKLRKSKNKYNENLKIIEKKKKEIENLQATTNTNVLNNITITNKNASIYYFKIIEKIKNEIILKEHELEIFKKLYSDIYKQNYILKSKLVTENKLSEISNEQHEKYVSIKNVSLSKLIKQEEMLKTLNYYFNKCQETNKDLISEKIDIINKINNEIRLLKIDEQKVNKNIEEIKDKTNKINPIIKEKQKLYNIIYNDYKYMKKIFCQNQNHMNIIYNILGVIDVDNILKMFKKLRQRHNELSLTLSYKSKEIVSLNEELTNLNKSYENILKDINYKKRMENYISKKIKYNNNFENFESLIASSKNIFIEKYDIFKDKLELFNKCLSLILRTINNIINSSKSSIDLDTPYEDGNKNRNNILSEYQEYYKNNFIQNKSVNFDKEFINKQFIKFIIFILNELNYRINSITSNIYNILYKKEVNKESEPTSKIKGLTNSDNDDINILPFNTKRFKTIFLNELKIKKEKLEEEKKFKEENEKNVRDKNDPYYLPSIEKDSLSRNKSMDYIPTKDFLYNYYRHYKKTIQNKKNSNIHSNNTYYKNRFNNNENTSSNFYNCSTKYNDSDTNKINLNKFNFVINYTNDFVSDKNEIEAKNNEKNEKILKKSKIIKEKVEQDEILKFLKRLKKNKKNRLHYYSQDDISIYTDEKDENDMKEELKAQLIHQELMELKKPKKYFLKYENEEIGKIFERYDEIRILELNFLKNKKNYIIDSNFFNEYYFKLKNKFKENSIKENFRAKLLKQKKDLLYKTINQTIDMNKYKVKKDNDNESIIKHKYYNRVNKSNIGKNDVFYNTTRCYNMKSMVKSNSYLKK